MDRLRQERQEEYGDVYATAQRYSPGLPLRYPLDMVRAKVARLQFNPEHEDSWRDLAEYAHIALMFLQRGRHE